MYTTPRLALVLALVLLAGSGCAVSSDGPDAGASSTPPSATPTTAAPTGSSGTPSPTATTGGGITLPDDLRTRPAVAAAIADTAGRKGVAPDAVVIAAWTPVTWSDGSLGCPQKGMAYTQALVDGELLLLRVGTGLFQYHARAGGPFTYCASPSADYTVGG
ncbi:MAG TPA: hypothetical protein VES93_12925 [Ornithinibacter sp.]|nr:hypothetical protein [Ornithinibacter sp.]